MADSNAETTSSKEKIALELTNAIAVKEDIYSDKATFRTRILDLYAECLNATNGYRSIKAPK
jgi:hypothetical protein